MDIHYGLVICLIQEKFMSILIPRYLIKSKCNSMTQKIDLPNLILHGYHAPAKQLAIGKRKIPRKPNITLKYFYNTLF